MEDKIVVEFDDDECWNLGYGTDELVGPHGENGYVGSWEEADAGEFVDALLELVMRRARARGVLL
jgi:hypothetical protein